MIGIDLQRVEPLEGVEIIRGDFTRPDVQQDLHARAGTVSVVVSDMSPNISGDYGTDHARSVHLAELALEFATRVLKEGGVFVVKVFEGDLFPDYVRQLRARFAMVKAHHPEASRSSSSEVYVIAKGFGRSGAGSRVERDSAA